MALSVCDVASAGRKPALLQATLLALVFFVGVILPVRAQSPRAPERLLHFTVFSARPVTDVAFAPTAGAAPQTCAFYPTARSPRYSYRGAMPLKLVDPKSGAVVAEVAVPPGVNDALIYLAAIMPAPASGPRYTALVIDDGALHHGAGGLVVGNFSGLVLAGTLEGKPLTLTEGLNAPQAVGGGAKLVLRTTFKERSYQAYAGEVTLKKNQRALLLLLPPFYKGSLEVQSRPLIDEPPAVPMAR